MKITKGSITQKEIETVLKIYKETRTDEYISSNHGPDIDKLIHYSDIVYCDTSNAELNSIVSNIVKEDKQIYSIHIVTYTTGDNCDRHLDRSSNTTYITLLTDSFTGGELKVNDKVCELKKGDTVMFNGQRDYHEVTPIQSGVRQVLVIWTGIRQENRQTSII